MFDNHHHGAAHVSVYLASPAEVQQALVAAEPERYWVPPYVGHRGWVAVVLDTGPDWERVGELVRAAFEFLALPRRARLSLRQRRSAPPRRATPRPR
jgi:predicted DNA-binding protein (MmcQ/YjbR family)